MLGQFVSKIVICFSFFSLWPNFSCNLNNSEFPLIVKTAQCNELSFSQDSLKVDKELLPYVDQFIKDCIANGINYNGLYNFDSISYIPVENPNLLGLCYPEKRAVFIFKNSNYTSFSLACVVYHELGHCVLGFSHKCGTRPLIMNPITQLENMEDYPDWEVLVADYFKDSGYYCEIPSYRSVSVDTTYKPH